MNLANNRTGMKKAEHTRLSLYERYITNTGNYMQQGQRAFNFIVTVSPT